MSIRASHRGIAYRLEEAAPREWHWSFTPPRGKRRSGRVHGEYAFALTVVRRGIDVWCLMNPDQPSQAA